MRQLLIPGLLVFSTVTVSVSQSPLEIEGIHSGLKRSPDDFVAGVFEGAGRVQCDGRGDSDSLCWLPAVVVEEFASRPARTAPRTMVKVLTIGQSGEQRTGRFIAFLVPVKDTDIYSGSLMMTYGPQKLQRIRSLVETAIAGERSL